MFRSRIPSAVKFLLKDIICRIPQPLLRGEVDGKKTVFLTFDDGPIPETTSYILDTLKKYGIKATFFCVGENVEKYPELFERILSEGHTIGNHSYNHLNGWKTPLFEYINNINECNKVLTHRSSLITHHSPLITLFRPPYGKLTLNQYNILKKKYKLIFWDVMTPDFDVNVSAEYCLKMVKKKTSAGSILVFHDNLKAKNKLTKLLPGTLDFLLNEKFDIQPVTG